MDKIRCKDYWKQKNLIFGLSNDKKMVAIGEELEENVERFIHIDVKDFIPFAEKVIKEANTEKKEAVKMGSESWHNESYYNLKKGDKVLIKTKTHGGDKGVEGIVTKKSYYGHFGEKYLFYVRYKDKDTGKMKTRPYSREKLQKRKRQ